MSLRKQFKQGLKQLAPRSQVSYGTVMHEFVGSYQKTAAYQKIVDFQDCQCLTTETDKGVWNQWRVVVKQQPPSSVLSVQQE